ncbi:ABC transporter ATP-binding protein YvcR [Nonlabens ulvanivorans]|nr:ABC transporter ATP-binding protein YvcR [Nonlabens ulvanivorans]
MIEIKDLHKSYSTGNNSLHVLKGINFSVKEGELVSIMGSSGSGKSTLLNILGMLDEADQGSYTLDGVPIKNLNEKLAAQYRNKFLGFIFQSFNLINYKNAIDNVALPLYYQKVGRKERDERAMHYLEKVGLADWQIICLINYLVVRNNVLQLQEH